MKLKVTISELLQKTIEIEVPEGTSNPKRWAELEAEHMWRDSDVIITADDFVDVQFNAE